MMGFQTDSQERLFYSFNLEDHAPKNHLLRGIDQYLDPGDLRQYLTEFYSHTEKPSIDPELMIRMLVIGYVPEPDNTWTEALLYRLFEGVILKPTLILAYTTRNT